MTTLQRLGLSSLIHQGPDRPPIRVPVFVVWCELPLGETLRQLQTDGFPCPQCQRAWPIGRSGGVLAAVCGTPNCGSVSDSCAGCGAEVHFDATPEEQRAILRWPRCAVEIAEDPWPLR